jgi:hypothetical protein
VRILFDQGVPRGLTALSQGHEVIEEASLFGLNASLSLREADEKARCDKSA